jgi:hypothetical protein
MIRIVPTFWKRCLRGFCGRNGALRSVREVYTNTVVGYNERQNQTQITEFISQKTPCFSRGLH